MNKFLYIYFSEPRSQFICIFQSCLIPQQLRISKLENKGLNLKVFSNELLWLARLLHFTRNSCFKLTCHTANGKELNYQVQKNFFQHVISSWYSCVVTLFLVWRNLPHSSASTPEKRKTPFIGNYGNYFLSLVRNSKRQHIICSYFAINYKLTRILRSAKYFHILKIVSYI